MTLNYPDLVNPLSDVMELCRGIAGCASLNAATWDFQVLPCPTWRNSAGRAKLNPLTLNFQDCPLSDVAELSRGIAGCACVNTLSLNFQDDPLCNVAELGRSIAGCASLRLSEYT